MATTSPEAPIRPQPTEERPAKTSIADFVTPQTLVAVLSSAAALVLGWLINLVEPKSVLAAVGVIAMVCVVNAAVASLFWAGISRRIATHATELIDRTFASLANAHHGTGYGVAAVLEPERVFELERNAREVWVYAQELKWEATSDLFLSIVESNAKRGVPYRYLLPDTELVRNRVRTLAKRIDAAFEETAALAIKRQIVFRFRTDQSLIRNMCISIYNPNLLVRNHGTYVSVVVLFPPAGQDSFLRMPARAADDFEEQFDLDWNRSTPEYCLASLPEDFWKTTDEGKDGRLLNA